MSRAKEVFKDFRNIYEELAHVEHIVRDVIPKNALHLNKIKIEPHHKRLLLDRIKELRTAVERFEKGSKKLF